MVGSIGCVFRGYSVEEAGKVVTVTPCLLNSLLVVVLQTPQFCGLSDLAHDVREPNIPHETQPPTPVRVERLPPSMELESGVGEDRRMEAV